MKVIPKRLTRAIRLLLVAVAAMTVTAGLASPAQADGHWTKTVSYGKYSASVVSGEDRLNVTLGVTDPACDGMGTGLRVTAFTRGGTEIFGKSYINTLGCNSTKMFYPKYTASDLEGHRSGYVEISYFKYRNGLSYGHVDWVSTFYSLG